MEIKEQILKQNLVSRGNNPKEFIVVHYLGSIGDAKANCEYFKDNRASDGSPSTIGAHYFTNYNGDIYRSVLDDDVVSHCGANGGTCYYPKCRNANSIGIEMCVRNKNGNVSGTDKNAGWYFEDATIKATQRLVAELMVKYGIPIENVIRHYDVTHKMCPAPYCNGQLQWSDFIAGVKTEEAKFLAPPVTIVPPLLPETEEAIDLLTSHGMITVPSVWKKNAVETGDFTVRGADAAAFLRKIARWAKSKN